MQRRLPGCWTSSLCAWHWAPWCKNSAVSARLHSPQPGMASMFVADRAARPSREAPLLTVHGCALVRSGWASAVERERWREGRGLLRIHIACHRHEELQVQVFPIIGARMLLCVSACLMCCRYLLRKGLEAAPRSRYLHLTWALWEKELGQRANARLLLRRGHGFNRSDPALLQARLARVCPGIHMWLYLMA